jgi:hypothetical protein
MKSFSQFLQESYLSEEEARQLRLLKRDNKTPYKLNKPIGGKELSTDPTPAPTSKRLSAAAPEAPKTSPGQLEIPEPKTSKVSGSQFRNAGEARQGSFFTRSGKPQNFGGKRTPFVATEPVRSTKRLSAAAPEAPKTSPGQMEIDFNARPNKGGALATRPTSLPSAPVGSKSNPQRIFPTPVSKSAQTPKGGSLSVRSSSTPQAPLGSKSNPQRVNPTPVSKPTGSSQKALPAGKQVSTPPSPTTTSKSKLPAGAKPSSKWAKIGKFAGPASAALDTAFSTADERAKGSGWARSLAKGATVAAGGLLGGTAGAIGGGGILSAATGTAGAMAGAAAAEKAFDTVAGANARERKAMAQANRQRQSGTAVKGIGGKTTFSQAKPGGAAFMSTGVGKQRKTVQLAKTGVVQRGGQSVAGHLAFKGGKAVYKAGPSAQTLAKTSSNPLERIGRSLFAGAYKKHDAAKAQQALQKARQSDAARNLKLGVKTKPAG